MELKLVLNIQCVDLLEISSCNRAIQNTVYNNFRAVCSQSCEEERENGGHLGIPYMVKILVTFRLKGSTGQSYG